MKFIYTFLVAIFFCSFADVAFASEGGLPWGNFLLRVLNFAIFIGIIWYFTGQKIKDYFTSYRKEAALALEDARKMKIEAIKQLEAAEARLNSVEAECNKLIAEGKKQAEAMKNTILEDAKKQAERMVSQAKQAAEVEVMQERAHLQAKMADEIVAELEKEITSRLDKDAHVKLVEKSLSKVVLA